MRGILRVVLSGCLGLLLTAAVTVNSFGALIGGDAVQVNYGLASNYVSGVSNLFSPPGSPPGGYYSGAFQIEQLTGQDGQPLANFATFCLEMNQALDPYWPNYSSGIYTVSSITPTTDFGVPISDETKFLFSNYVNGSLGSALQGLFTYDDADSANYLQQAIWFFQGNGLSIDNLDQGAQDIVTLVTDSGYAKQTNQINALNLYAATNPLDPTQALLIMAPANAAPPPPSVPEPATLSIWAGLGIAGLVLAGRRRRCAV